MKEAQKKLILNRLTRLIDYDMLSDEVVEEIDLLITKDLAEEEQQIDTEDLSLNTEEEVSKSQGYNREILDDACESGICPSR